MAKKYKEFIKASFKKTKTDDTDLIKNVKFIFEKTITDFKNIRKNFKI